MAKQHLVISGTGRAGTTALVRILAAAGLDALSDDMAFSERAQAGLESFLCDPEAPYVVKNPSISDELGPLLDSGFDPSRIDALVVTVRPIDEVVLSRVENFMTGGPAAFGGLWRNIRPSRQKAAMTRAFHELMVTAAEHSIPVAVLSYPRFVNDWQYCFAAIGPYIDVDEPTFRDGHTSVAVPRTSAPTPPLTTAELARADARWAYHQAAAATKRLRSSLPGADAGPPPSLADLRDPD